jgi:hypothetical protein
MTKIVRFALFVLLALYSGGCATASWPAKVYRDPALSLSNYYTFSFTLPFTANIVEEEGRDKIIKLLEQNGYKYIEDRDTADFVVEEKCHWEEKEGYTPSRMEYTPIYTRTTIIYIPSYVPGQPYIYYEFHATLTFYDRASQRKIYEGATEGTTVSLDLGDIYQDIIKQSNLPVSLGKTRVLATEPYKVYANRDSKVYHRAGCPELGAEGLIEFKSPEEAIAAGALSCPKCSP